MGLNLGNLNGDGSLMLPDYAYGDVLMDHAAVGNPTDFIPEDPALTNAALAPEPTTFGMVTLVGLSG